MKFEKLFEILVESPVDINHIDFPDFKSKEETLNTWNSFDKVGNFFIDEKEIEIYSLRLIDSIYRSYILTHGDKVLAKYEGDTRKKGSIETLHTHSSKFIKGESLMFHFYVNFLLRQFKSVISDELLTKAAFNFYYRNYNAFISMGYHIFAVKDDNKIPIFNKDQLLRYFTSSGNTDSDFQYMITK